MTSQPGIQTSTIHILPNISRNKDYQTIKFGKLIFVQKSYTDLVEKVVLDRFLKNQNSADLWINSLKFYTACFFCMSKSKIIKTC